MSIQAWRSPTVTVRKGLLTKVRKLSTSVRYARWVCSLRPCSHPVRRILRRVRDTEFFAAYETLLYDFYAQHVGDILELPPEDIKKIQMVYGPKLFTPIERMGSDALIAPNGVVAGDSFGNGHFLTSGGAMTGWSCTAGVSTSTTRRSTPGSNISRPCESSRIASGRIPRPGSTSAPGNTARRFRSTLAHSGLRRSKPEAVSRLRRARQRLMRPAASDIRCSRWTRPIGGDCFCATVLCTRPSCTRCTRAPHTRAAQKGDPRDGGICRVRPAANTLRFMAGVLGQPGVRMGLVTSASRGQLPERMRKRLAAVEHIADARDPDQIVEAIHRMPDALGHPERLFSSADELVVPLAQVRGRMDIEGMRGNVARAFRDADRMRDKLSAAGLPIAQYVRVESVQDALAFGTDMVRTSATTLWSSSRTRVQTPPTRSC